MPLELPELSVLELSSGSEGSGSETAGLLLDVVSSSEELDEFPDEPLLGLLLPLPDEPPVTEAYQSFFSTPFCSI